MLDQSRFELMRQDLHRAAATIKKLKREREDFKYSYEVLKRESISKKDMLRNQGYVESLKDTNEMLQQEVLRLRVQSDSQNQTIASLEEKLISAKHNFKTQLKGLKDIENARKELNHEISNTVFKDKNLPTHSETINLTEKLLFSIKSNLPIHRIFKQTVRCNKNFLSLVQSEKFCLAFQLIGTFVLDLIESFMFCEEQEESCSSEREWNRGGAGSKYNGDYKESSENQSIRLQILQRKLKETLDEHRMENEELSKNLNKKKIRGPSCDLASSAGRISKESLSKGTGYSKAKRISERPSLYIESPALEGVSDACNNPSYRSVKYQDRRLSTSKSPIRQVSPKGRFEEFKVPFRKIQGSASVAECLGKNAKSKN